MKKTFLFLVFQISISVMLAQNITGNWLGTLDIMGNKLRIGFQIEKKDTLLVTKMDSPDQGAFGLPTNRTTFIENELEIVASGLGITYRGTLVGDSIQGFFGQGGMSLPLVLKRNESPTITRPQHPTPPFDYKTEEVTFENKKDKVKLAGTLTLPDSTGTFPTVILVAGSGANDRDETVFGHKPFLVIADYLTKNGFAVLRYDKRGVGSSEGNFMLATIDNFADDANAALTFLRSRPEIDKKRIGIIGHSEGGIVASMLAAENKNVAFAVLMASPGIAGIDVILFQNEISMQQSKMEPENIERLQILNRELLQSLQTWENTDINRTDLRDRLGSIWEQLPILNKMEQKKDIFVRNQFNAITMPGYRSFIKSNSQNYLAKVKIPVLAINGENDKQVEAKTNLSGIKKGLEQGKNYRYEIKSYPALNHLFQVSETGWVDEYGKIEQTISPDVLKDITNWLKKVCNDIK